VKQFNDIAALVAHPGTQYAPRLAAELYRHAALSRFVSGIAVPDDGFLGAVDKLMPAVLRRRWANRRVRGVPAARLKAFPRLEWAALRRLRRGEAAETVFAERNEAFQRAIPDRWIEEATHTIGFDTSSWLLAARTIALNRPFVLDQSIGHPRTKERIYSELRVRFPEWAETVPHKSQAHLDRERTEHEFASAIVAPSNFVKRTLAENGVNNGKVHIIPFGTDLQLFAPPPSPSPGKVVFLFAGTLTARKGVPVLLQAWREAKLTGRAELWLAGGGRVPLSAKSVEGVRWLGALSRVSMAETMRRAHVFVCPSFFEGLAQVQIEALAAGLPVIGTTASGAGEIVSPGETGMILEPGERAELVDALRTLSDDAERRRLMRERCIASRDSLSWAKYGQRWLHFLRSVRSNEEDVSIATMQDFSS